MWLVSRVEIIHKVEGAKGLQVEGQLVMVEVQEATEKCQGGKQARDELKGEDTPLTGFKTCTLEVV